MHPVSEFGGASKSLLELCRVLKGLGCDVTVLCPRGASAYRFSQSSIRVVECSGLSQFDNTFYGHYRGLRWLILLREIWLLLSSIRGILRAIKNKNYDIVHLNEVTLLPLGLLAKSLAHVPLVVHVRSVQRGEAADFRTKWLSYILKEKVDRVIAIDETVKNSLPRDIDVRVIHNSFRVEGYRKRLEEKSIFRVGMVGVLLKLKGCYEFIQAARILVKERGINVEFLLVGENARAVGAFKGWLLKKFGFSHDVKSDLINFVRVNQLDDHVKFLGFQSDVQSIYQILDLLCFPSYLNAVGRPVFEAAFFGVPSIVAVREPPAEVLVPGETGLCIDLPDPVAIADAIEYFFRHRGELRRMGRNAQLLAQKNFVPEVCGAKVYEVYQDCAAD